MRRVLGGTSRHRLLELFYGDEGRVAKAGFFWEPTQRQLEVLREAFLAVFPVIQEAALTLTDVDAASLFVLESAEADLLRQVRDGVIRDGVRLGVETAMDGLGTDGLDGDEIVEGADTEAYSGEFTTNTLTRLTTRAVELVGNLRENGASVEEVEDALSRYLDEVLEVEVGRVGRGDLEKGGYLGVLLGFTTAGAAWGKTIALEGACELCMRYHGRIWPLEWLMGTMPFHPNCRCVVEPIWALGDGDEVEAEPPVNVFGLERVPRARTAKSASHTGDVAGELVRVSGLPFLTPEQNRVMRKVFSLGELAQFGLGAVGVDLFAELMRQAAAALERRSASAATVVRKTEEEPFRFGPVVFVARPSGGDLNRLWGVLEERTGRDRTAIKQALALDGDLSVRAAVEEALFLGLRYVPNAVLLLTDDRESTIQWLRDRVVWGNGAGDEAARERVVQLLAGLPVYDLGLIDRVEVYRGGHGVCIPAKRTLEVPQDISVGDMRHLVGHLVWSVLPQAMVDVVMRSYAANRQRLIERGFTQQVGVEVGVYERAGALSYRALGSVDEFYAECYRVYHREVNRDRYEGGVGDGMWWYRVAYSEVAAVMDAHYTAAWVGQEHENTDS